MRLVVAMAVSAPLLVSDRAWRARLALLFALVVFSPLACSTEPNGDDTRAEPEPPGEAAESVAQEDGFTIEIDGDVDAGALTVVGTTDLPDRTQVTISAQRAFLNPDSAEDNPRAASAGRIQVSVDQGGFEGG
jgi:hypothetical protein